MFPRVKQVRHLAEFKHQGRSAAFEDGPMTPWVRLALRAVERPIIFVIRLPFFVLGLCLWIALYKDLCQWLLALK